LPLPTRQRPQGQTSPSSRPGEGQWPLLATDGAVAKLPIRQHSKGSCKAINR
jgi:hypothetical protein